MPGKSTAAPNSGQSRNRRPYRVKDITGKRFGMLVVQGMAPNLASYGRILWTCICDCGNTKDIEGTNLRRGLSKSCGCQIEVALRARKGEKRTHGYSNSWVHSVWYKMIQRCYDPACPSYANYGGRGIRVCERWKNSIGAFHEDMGDRTSSAHSIERIDNDGDYEPANCRWATAKEQANNRTSSRLIACLGRVQTLAQWSEEVGLSGSVIHCRIQRGWTVEEAITKPLGFRRPR